MSSPSLPLQVVHPHLIITFTFIHIMVFKLTTCQISIVTFIFIKIHTFTFNLIFNILKISSLSLSLSSKSQWESLNSPRCQIIKHCQAISHLLLRGEICCASLGLCSPKKDKRNVPFENTSYTYNNAYTVIYTWHSYKPESPKLELTMVSTQSEAPNLRIFFYFLRIIFFCQSKHVLQDPDPGSLFSKV